MDPKLPNVSFFQSCHKMRDSIVVRQNAKEPTDSEDPLGELRNHDCAVNSQNLGGFSK